MYTRIMVAMQKHIVSVHLFAKQRREKAMLGQVNTTRATLPVYSLLDVSRHVKAHPPPLSCISGNTSMFYQCCDFLTRLRFAPLRVKSGYNTMPEQGTSWIELFILLNSWEGMMVRCTLLRSPSLSSDKPSSCARELFYMLSKFGLGEETANTSPPPEFKFVGSKRLGSTTLCLALILVSILGMNTSLTS